LPIALVINGSHAGEVEGKEASMMLLRDLLDGKHAGLLAELTLVVVPLFNPDGNDALSTENRVLDLPNLAGQIGPAKVGTRVNAAGINLNRDYMRQQAPEMRLLQSRVVQVWEPDLTIDTHATNGSLHRMWMTYDVPHTVASGRGEPVAFMREQMMPAVQAALASDHGLPLAVLQLRRGRAHARAWPPRTARSVGEGWMVFHQPRFGSNYRGLSSRLDCCSSATRTPRSPTAFARRTRRSSRRCATSRAIATTCSS
jgi:hypothetical protein